MTTMAAESSQELVNTFVTALEREDLEALSNALYKIPKVVEKFAHAPAVLFDVSERGYLREGFFADLVLVDMDDPYTVERANVLSKCGWSPFEGARFRSELPKLRSAIYYDLGVMLPMVHVSGDAPLEETQYFIAVKEVPVVYGAVYTDKVYVNASAERLEISLRWISISCWLLGWLGS